MNDRGTTLIEVLVALIVASGTIVVALEVSRLTVNRSAASVLQLEAILDAETLLSRVGFDIPLHVGQQRQDSPERGIRRQVDIQPLDDDLAWPRAYQVSSDVAVVRGGLSERSRLTTIKLQWKDR